jgi:hypothetical protein
VAVIGQQRDGLAGLGGGQQHHAVTGGEAARHVTREAGGELQGEIPATAAIAGLHVDFGLLCGDIEMHGHGGVALAARLGDERVAHQRDDFGIHQPLADGGKFEDTHGSAYSIAARDSVLWMRARSVAFCRPSQLGWRWRTFHWASDQSFGANPSAF